MGRCSQLPTRHSQLHPQPPDVLAQDRVQVRIHDRRVTSADDLDERSETARHTDLGEADFASDPFDELLVFGVRE